MVGRKRGQRVACLPRIGWPAGGEGKTRRGCIGYGPGVEVLLVPADDGMYSARGTEYSRTSGSDMLNVRQQQVPSIARGRPMQAGHAQGMHNLEASEGYMCRNELSCYLGPLVSRQKLPFARPFACLSWELPSTEKIHATATGHVRAPCTNY